MELMLAGDKIAIDYGYHRGMFQGLSGVLVRSRANLWVIRLDDTYTASTAGRSCEYTWVYETANHLVPMI